MANLKEIANQVFEKNKEAEKVFVTSDGVPFLSQNAATLHATTNPIGKKLKIKVFTKEADSTNPPTKLTAEQRIAKIENLKTVAEVEAFLKGEKAKTVIEAGKNRIDELYLIEKSGTNSPETRGNDIDNPDEQSTDNTEE